MTKIALCLSGMPRFWDRMDLTDYGEVDVFIHSWTDISNTPNCLNELFPTSKASLYKANDYLLNTLKPKAYLFEEPKDFSQLFQRFRNCEGKCRQSVLPMFWSVKKSLELALTSPDPYDIIVRGRFDIRFEQPIEYIKNDKINISDQFHYMGVCDQFAYGNPKAMKVYSEVYDYLESCPDIQLNPEIILKRWLHLNNLEINLTNDDFFLLR